ncbi:hypothetical protein [Methylobacterium goesingense]|uniref:Cell division protein FtsB n=1 Tax=Methylobacterium goesingense TaxID=243690 RepID=A0ABV2LDF7_9HYPH|nr:hypothetical protein [Methylobacterium goesingense]
MRAHQIIQDYIDPTRMPVALYKEIVSALARTSATPASSEFIQVLYSDERDELELEQLRLDLTQTRAEVEQLHAGAARNRAAARRELAAAEDDE